MSRPRNVVIVTGSAGSIGSAITKRLAGDGFHVVGIDREQPGAPDATATMTLTAGDVTDPSTCGAVFATAASHGVLTGLVNCAGVVPTSPALEVTLETWQQTMQVNLYAAYFLAVRAAREMATRGGGSIVNVGSIAGSRPSPLTLAYAASKAALSSMTTALAHELASQGVRVNAVCPGLIETSLTAAVDAQVAQLTGTTLEATRRRRRDAVPMTRAGEPSEVADAVSFLMSDRASYITGQALHVNGGALMTT